VLTDAASGAASGAGEGLQRALREELAAWDAAGLRRRLLPADPATRGRDFTSNDVLGLARHPALIEAGCAALVEHGAGGRASRLLGGGCALDARVEQAAADWLGAEAGLLFPSGYQANLGLVGALAGRGDALFCDELLHASLIDAARLSRAQVCVHRHGDLEHLGALLARAAGARRRLVLTEGIFSMDGDRAPLPELAALCARHDAALLVDEAHAAGVLGPAGAGAWAEAVAQGTIAPELQGRLAARLVTGGKALGVAGACVVGSAALREVLVHRARSFVFTTAVSPAVPGALLAAIALVRSAAGDALRAQLAARTAQLARGLARPAPPAAIVPLVLGESAGATAAAARLVERGLDVRAVRPPTVPEGTARLRLVCHADHAEADVARLLAALSEAGVREAAHGQDAAHDTHGVRAPSHALVVVGTDTGVGKTVVSALLLRAALHAPEAHATYWKPVQTGPDSDTDAVRELAARASFALPLHALALAASPHAAAAAAGVRIELDDVQQSLADLVRATAGTLVVELAGGLLVPYDERHTQADLLARAGLPVVLVARSGLGTLNHTLLTLEALAGRGVAVRALFLVGPPHAGNRETLERRSGVAQLFELPLLEPLDGAALDTWLAHCPLASLLEADGAPRA
jgi:8-amino-7-oxononanoate synthase